MPRYATARADTGSLELREGRRHNAKQLVLLLHSDDLSATSDFQESDGLALGPLDATFRDSGRAPLHSWFPYLEGYSPRFVERVRAEYLPAARRIIEPFAGTGTTPIVLGQGGVSCAFSEANPAMSFIAETKLRVLRLTLVERRALAQRLNTIAKELSRRSSAATPDAALRAAYGRTFGKSIFFESDSFESILRIRTTNDKLCNEGALVSECFTVAVLASLIPSSRLKRAGDLRYRTEKELAAGIPHPLDMICARLAAQAADLVHCAAVTGDTTFACATAGNLHEALDGDWDGVITSPPYLNGTNYIRNARLELWYLRHLHHNADIRRLRDRVITSGINDVDADTKWTPVTDGVHRVVKQIEANTYDSRIAKMVGGYFYDMAAVFSSLRQCIRKSGRLCVDIGDSIYNGIHVPTDDLLVEVAESLGYRSLERIHLRKRTSKGGAAVRQQLLVFEKSTRTRRVAKDASIDTNDVAVKVSAVRLSKETNEWWSRWEDFKRTLPHQLQPYAKREWGGPEHSMCSYQGKLKPSLAHHLISCFSVPGDIVLDPFFWGWNDTIGGMPNGPTWIRVGYRQTRPRLDPPLKSENPRPNNLRAYRKI